MKQIYKYVLDEVSRQFIEMPEGAKILSAQLQNSVFCIWAIVDETANKQERCFEIIGTGDTFNDNNKEYIGTVQRGGFVFHIFEVL